MQNNLNYYIEQLPLLLKQLLKNNPISYSNLGLDLPARGSRYYRFENKYSHSLKYARVLRCGLKMKSKVISPCIVVQLEN